MTTRQGRRRRHKRHKRRRAVLGLWPRIPYLDVERFNWPTIEQWYAEFFEVWWCQ